ncbi:T9SS type A sorting domain-containing protein, partial [Tenacibaculum sp. 1_MG-2023]|uniref:T9SS type A sorting domain-containing protein n=1 Tax=Tenacibaculum sp. 1_MG-2023 TaxID=3062653 RepID=UPI0026E26049
GTCPNSSAVSVTVNALDDASFNYSAAAYCADDTDPMPTITGLTGGSFSSTSGLSINSGTGAIDVSASTPGTYSVTYTTSGTCPNSTSVSVTVNALDDASFNYGAATYDVNDSDPTPNFSGLTGGAFTSTTGIVLNSSDGTIDLSASEPGSYVITYTVTGTCNTVMKTQNVEITGTVLDIDDEELTSKFTIYPNPTINIVKIKSNKTITRVIVHDIIGRRIKSVKLDDEKQIDLSELDRATYLLTFFNEGEMLGTKTVIKK